MQYILVFLECTVLSSAYVLERKGGRGIVVAKTLHCSLSSAGCVLFSAQLNTLEKVSAVRSQRPVQAERSVFAGRVLGTNIRRHD
jgi:hypothetical protein